MKRRTQGIILTGVLLLILGGCGKDNKVVTSDNAGVSGSVVVGSDSSTFVPYGEATPSTTSEVSSISDDSISSDSISGDAISENKISESSMPSTVPEEVSENTSLIDMTTLEDSDNCLYIVNMTGINIESLSITFSAGSINNMEILKDETFKDGTMFTYSILDMDSLKNESQLFLTISAVDRNNQTMTFPETRIVDPSHMRVLLTQTEDGYAIVLQ